MPADAREMLRKENEKKKNEEKFLPLTYRQVKHIVNSFKNENGIQDINSIDNAMILTKDNSLFLRYNSSFYGLHQSKRK